jgi:hypothetical protein
MAKKVICLPEETQFERMQGIDTVFRSPIVWYYQEVDTGKIERIDNNRDYRAFMDNLNLPILRMLTMDAEQLARMNAKSACAVTYQLDMSKITEMADENNQIGQFLGIDLLQDQFIILEVHY